MASLRHGLSWLALALLGILSGVLEDVLFILVLVPYLPGSLDLTGDLFWVFTVPLAQLLALSLTLVHQGHISMARMIEALSLAPASILDIRGGTLSPGSSADFILFRPDSGWIVKSANFISNSRITPFELHPVQGIVDATYVDGTAIFLRD